MTTGAGYHVLGLLCGTSHDGVDAALLATDGDQEITVLARRVLPFAPAMREALAALVDRARRLGPEGRARLEQEARSLETPFLDHYVRCAQAVMAEAGMSLKAVDAVGFHGLTLLHRPDRGFTWQWGSARRLARMLDRPVIAGFREDDMAAGGQGAPLVPIYHYALVTLRQLVEPVAILNIGGVANVTWVDPRKKPADGGLLAFDTGPGNGLIDSWMQTHAGLPCDRGGRHAAAGRVDPTVLAALLDSPYFSQPPPKSLDKHDFSLSACEGLRVEDGAATLTAFTAEAIALAARWFPETVGAWWVTGGGRHNAALMRAIRKAVAGSVQMIEEVGCDGDSLEAEAFAYLASRRMRGLPASFPTTTGVLHPRRLGRVIAPDNEKEQSDRGRNGGGDQGRRR